MPPALVRPGKASPRSGLLDLLRSLGPGKASPRSGLLILTFRRARHTCAPTHAAIAQLDRASVYGTEGREFESLWPRRCPTIPRHLRRFPGGRRIAALDDAAAARARTHQMQLTKPPGSLGRLEELAVFYAGARGHSPSRRPARPRLYVFAADHGVTAEGVSLPVLGDGGHGRQLRRGRRRHQRAGARQRLELRWSTPAWRRRSRSTPGGAPSASTRRPASRHANLRRGPAMTRAEAQAALELGRRLRRRGGGPASTLLGSGEMGIGNTTAAAAADRRAHRRAADERHRPRHGRRRRRAGAQARVVRGRSRDQPDAGAPLDALAAVGGFEIAALAGAHARRRRAPRARRRRRLHRRRRGAGGRARCAGGARLLSLLAPLGRARATRAPATRSMRDRCWTSACAWARARARRSRSISCAPPCACRARWRRSRRRTSPTAPSRPLKNEVFQR